MKMFTGDLKPDLEISLNFDTTDATAIRILGKRGNEIIFDRAPYSTTPGDTSVITMQWQAPDTADRGDIAIEVEVMWPGNKPQTIRPGQKVSVLTDFDHA